PVAGVPAPRLPHFHSCAYSSRPCAPRWQAPRAATRIGSPALTRPLMGPDEGNHDPRTREDPHSARRALLALQFPDMLDFDDPALAGRRLFSELLGTFLLVMA